MKQAAVWSLVFYTAARLTWALIGRQSLGSCFNIVSQSIIRHQRSEGEQKMPVVVINTEACRFDLKSAPGCYVYIKEMSYGQRIHRSGLSGAMKVLKDTKSDYAGEIAMETARITEWDFANLIGEHNLEVAEGVPYNFANLEHLKKLPSRVGDEIGKYIDEVNSFEDIEEGN